MPLDTKKLKELAISESGLIFDPSTGVIYTSNPVGMLIINALKEGKDRNEIMNHIKENFEVDDGMAEKDLFDFTNQLISNGLIKDE